MLGSRTDGVEGIAWNLYFSEKCLGVDLVKDYKSYGKVVWKFVCVF